MGEGRRRALVRLRGDRAAVRDQMRTRVESVRFALCVGLQALRDTIQRDALAFFCEASGECGAGRIPSQEQLIGTPLQFAPTRRNKVQFIATCEDGYFALTLFSYYE